MPVLDGLQVFLPETASLHVTCREVEVIVAIHNPAVSVSALVEFLKGLGFLYITTFFDFCRAHAWLPDNAYWLNTNFDWIAVAPSVTKAALLFQDDSSRRTFSQLVALRRLGNYQDLSPPDIARQYFPEDIPPLPTPVRLIDCGAFVGDTIQNFVANGILLDSVLAFEPHPDHFKILCAVLEKMDQGRAWQAGVWSGTNRLNFSPEGSGSAHLSQSGESVIDVVSLDDAAMAFAPTLIKMDIEGAELEALHGARIVIERYRPRLAISVYHNVDHLWSIPLYLAKLSLGYRFYLRCHAHNGFDTVLYAVAS
ncbi:MAG: FkbM family methyltransferase [Magnetococcus sp. DMHC-1]